MSGPYTTPSKSTTRSSNFPFILENVLKQPDDSKLHRAFDACGYTTIQEIMEMSSDDIDNLCLIEILPAATGEPEPKGVRVLGSLCLNP